jgi:hypothetical protein
VLHCFDKGLGSVCAGDSVAWSKWESSLAYFYGSLAAGVIQQEPHSNDRIVQATGSNLIFDMASPNEGVSFEEVEKAARQRWVRNPGV